MAPAALKASLLEKARTLKEQRDLPGLREANPTLDDDVLLRSIHDDFENEVGAKVDSMLLQELDFPKFVIVDTNWGDDSRQLQMVVAADPSTGEPTIYELDTATGELSYPPASFRENEWSAVA
jgi:hypothetical protein